MSLSNYCATVAGCVLGRIELGILTMMTNPIHKNICKSIGAVVLAATVANCGPIAYVSTVTRGASDSIDVARQQNAEKNSPYWWTRATLYFHKAKEEAAHAGFAAANRYGQIANEAAERAAEEAAKPGAGTATPAKTEAVPNEDVPNEVKKAKVKS
jgi:hypothetical protein